MGNGLGKGEDSKLVEKGLGWVEARSGVRVGNILGE